MAIVRPALRGFLSTPSGGAIVTPSDIFTGADDDWWDASTDADMTFVAARTVDQYSITSEVATIRTTASHGMIAGDSVVVANVAAAVNGTFTVVSAPTTTTLTYSVPGQGNIGNTAASGTVNWEHRKMSAWAGKMGNWTLTQATLARMPQYNATTKKVLASRTRQYFMEYSSGLFGAMGGADLGLWAVSARTAGQVDVYLFSMQLNTTQHYLRFSSGFTDPTQQVYIVGAGSPRILVYKNADTNDGNLKCWFVNGDVSNATMYMNDTSTSVATEAHDGRPTSGANVFYLFRQITAYYSGNVGSHGFKVGGTLTEQNRIDLKAWGESQGDTYG